MPRAMLSRAFALHRCEPCAQAKIKIGWRGHDLQASDQATERGLLFTEGAARGARVKMRARAPAQSLCFVRLFDLNPTCFAVHLSSRLSLIKNRLSASLAKALARD